MEEQMHTIVKNISNTPYYFQRDVDEMVDEYCNQKGYRISQISNLVRSDIGGRSERDQYNPRLTSETRSISLSQTFVLVKD